VHAAVRVIGAVLACIACAPPYGADPIRAIVEQALPRGQRLPRPVGDLDQDPMATRSAIGEAIRHAARRGWPLD